MGHKCNSRYKLSQDILKKNDGTRRRAMYPYGNTGIRISLDNSLPFNGEDGIIPKWQIQFDPDTEEATTWDEVFQIRTRYKRDVLNISFKSLLTDFSRWCKYSGVELETDEALINAIDRYTVYWGSRGFQDRAFLRAAVFRMLKLQCENGNRRLILLFHDIVISP
jgi:hypothetical protein